MASSTGSSFDNPRTVRQHNRETARRMRRIGLLRKQKRISRTMAFLMEFQDIQRAGSSNIWQMQIPGPKNNSEGLLSLETCLGSLDPETQETMATEISHAESSSTSTVSVLHNALHISSFQSRGTDNIEATDEYDKIGTSASDPGENYSRPWWERRGPERSYSEGSESEDHPGYNSAQQEGNRPLYNGSPVSVAESLNAIFLFALRHSITGQCLSDLLELLSLHCISPNLCRTTVYFFKKFFADNQIPLKFHNYCSICYKLLDRTVECSVCKQISEKAPVSSYLVEIPIVSQLQTLLNRKGFYEKLMFRFNREKKVANNIEDIFDGEIYKTMSFDGYSNSCNNLSFMWYCDGIPVFKSSKYTIWPMYLIINELAYVNRVSKENMIVAGIWFGPSKPCPDTFLKPLYDTFKEFSVRIPFIIAGQTNPKTFRGRLLCGTCDVPAKSLFLNMMQFNGRYGCALSKQKGVSVRTHNNTNVFVYPVENKDISGPLRTHDETVKFGIEASELGKPIFGVKGPTLLNVLTGNCISSVSIDIMHCVFLGICRKLMNLWFDPKFKAFPFSLSHAQTLVDNHLLQIKPPSFVQRVPHSLSDLKFWKALEFKYYLMCYSIPILVEIMDNDYLEHHVLLLTAIFLITQRSISHFDINTARRLITRYVFLFEKLYGKQFMSINVHQILHLPDVVSRLGPLWVTSCFPYEDLNGSILNFIHGTTHVDLQIASSVSAVLSCPSILDSFKEPSLVKSFCESMYRNGKSVKIMESISDLISVVGKYKELPLIPIKSMEMSIEMSTERHLLKRL